MSEERKGMGTVSSDILANALANADKSTIIIMDPKGENPMLPAGVLEKPYTQQEMKKRMNENGYVTGNVAIALSEIIACDLEQFLDLCAIRLVNNECLMDITYRAIGIRNVGSGDAGIIIEVTGDVSEILDDDLEDMIQDLKNAAMRMGDEVITDILGYDYKQNDDVGELLSEVLDQMPEEDIRKFHEAYCSEEMKKGYAVTDFDCTGMLEIQRIDMANIFASDEDAVKQAIEDGVKIIPVEELPGNFKRRYLGWIDTPENRKAIEEYCRTE